MDPLPALGECAADAPVAAEAHCTSSAVCTTHATTDAASRTEESAAAAFSEDPFVTTNGLVWKLVSTGVRLTSLPCGRRVRVPVYSQLGSGQYGRVFEVQLLGRVTEESSEAQTLSGKSGESSGADDEPRSLSSFPKNARLRETASEVRQALGLRSDFLFAAKLLPLPDFETQGATADLLREFALYGEVEGSLSGKSLNAGVPFPKTTASSCPKEAAADPQHSKSGGEREADFAPPPFANVVRVFGVKSSVRFSRAFSETYLSGVRTAGVLILERCFGDLASYVRRLYGANKMKIAALKFYAWQLLNGVARLHGRGVWHRDLKPENLLVAPAAVVEGQKLFLQGVAVLKVADLGMARKARGDRAAQAAGTRMTSVARLQENAPLNAPSSAACAERPGFAASMRQSAHVVTLPYRAPELICASCQFQSAARLPVSSVSAAVDSWSVGVVLLELCFLQTETRPPRWTYAFVPPAMKSGVFAMEFMVLDCICKVLGRPSEKELRELTQHSGEHGEGLRTFLNAYPTLSYADRKGALLDFILEHQGLYLDNLGLDLLCRLLHFAPSCRLSAEDALTHPWFDDLPFPAMTRLGLSPHSADISSPSCQSLLPSPVRATFAALRASGQSPSHAQWATRRLTHKTETPLQQPSCPQSLLLSSEGRPPCLSGERVGRREQQQRQTSNNNTETTLCSSPPPHKPPSAEKAVRKSGAGMSLRNSSSRSAEKAGGDERPVRPSLSFCTSRTARRIEQPRLPSKSPPQKAHRALSLSTALSSLTTLSSSSVSAVDGPKRPFLRGKRVCLRAEGRGSRATLGKADFHPSAAESDGEVARNSSNFFKEKLPAATSLSTSALRHLRSLPPTVGGAESLSVVSPLRKLREAERSSRCLTESSGKAPGLHSALCLSRETATQQHKARRPPGGCCAKENLAPSFASAENTGLGAEDARPPDSSFPKRRLQSATGIGPGDAISAELCPRHPPQSEKRSRR